MAACAYNPSAGEADREIPSVHGLPNLACLVSCRPVGELVSKNKTKQNIIWYLKSDTSTCMFTDESAHAHLHAHIATPPQQMDG